MAALDKRHQMLKSKDSQKAFADARKEYKYMLRSASRKQDRETLAKLEDSKDLKTWKRITGGVCVCDQVCIYVFHYK